MVGVQRITALALAIGLMSGPTLADDEQFLTQDLTKYVQMGPIRAPRPIDNAAFAQASGTPTAPAGRPDGSAFVAGCPDGSALVGLVFNAEVSLTGVAPVCQRVVEGELLGRQGPAPRTVAGIAADGAFTGSSPRLCPDHTAAIGLETIVSNDERRVVRVRLSCRPLSSSLGPRSTDYTDVRALQGTSTLDYPKGQNDASARKRASCAPGYATGLSGTYVDSITTTLPGRPATSTAGAITSLSLFCHSRERGATAVIPAAAQPDAAGPAGVAVNLAVDLYAAPGGKGDPTGSLEAGTAGVTLVEPCKESWCHVKWPGHEGWVYNADDYRSLKF